MKFVEIVNLAHKNPEALLYDKMHDTKLNVKNILQPMMEMIRIGVPPDMIQEECDNYTEIKE